MVIFIMAVALSNVLLVTTQTLLIRHVLLVSILLATAYPAYKLHASSVAVATIYYSVGNVHPHVRCTSIPQINSVLHVSLPAALVIQLQLALLVSAHTFSMELPA